MESETWAERGVEMNNHQWAEPTKHLEAMSEKMPGEFTQWLMVAVHALLSRGEEPRTACKKAFDIAFMMTEDGALDDD